MEASGGASVSTGGTILQRMIRPGGARRRSKYIPVGFKILFSGTSAVGATLVTHPFDVVKVNLQVSAETSMQRNMAESPMQMIAQSVRNKGPKFLYSGVGAAVLRQLSYGSVRLAIFDTFMSSYETKDGTPPSFGRKVVFSAIAGGIGAIIGNPADMTLVRMAADSRLPPEQRRNYQNVFDALARIRKEEGVLAWWKGSTPTVARCVVVNVSQLTTYSQVKQELLNRRIIKEDGLKCHVVSSMIAGFVATVATQPVDVVKTRVQNMKAGQSIGVFSCLSNIARTEGIAALWKGFIPAYARMAPQTTIMFILFEALKKRYQEIA